VAINITPSKENILKRIRKALAQTTPLPFPQSEMPAPVYPAQPSELDVLFAEQFVSLQGKFIYCASKEEFHNNWSALISKAGLEKIYCKDPGLRQLLGPTFESTNDHSDLSSCQASVTGCEAMVARTGTLVLSATASQGRTTSVYAPVHICIGFSNQLVYDVKDALLAIRNKYGDKIPSLITFASGPSRTADIEKTLVVGVHGPKEVYCFLLES
jgi:L-lactate dehydrogenase complex protein LldG